MDRLPPGLKGGDEPDPLAPADASGSTPEPVGQFVDPRPLAAYRLGFLSRSLWVWHGLFWEQRDYNESTWGSVPLALARIRAARIALKSEFDPKVYGDMGNALDELDRLTQKLVDAVRLETGLVNVNFDSKYPPGGSDWIKLRKLADLALQPGHAFQSFYHFGAALGEFRLKLWEDGAILSEKYSKWEDRHLDAGGTDPLPDVRPLVRSALRLPQTVVSLIPYIATLLEFAPLAESTERNQFLRAFLNRHSELCVPFHAVGGVDHSIGSNMTDNLDKAIENALATFGAESKSAILLGEELELNWNKETRELKAGSDVIRVFAKQATAIAIVLDSFQSLGWPRVIPNPFNEKGYPERLIQTLRSLNENLEVIEFWRAERGLCIAREWVANG